MKNYSPVLYAVFIMILSRPIFAQSHSIEIQSRAVGSEGQALFSSCEGALQPSLRCSADDQTNTQTWTNESIDDWAGTIMKATVRADDLAPGAILVGKVKFSYMPKAGVKAVALRSSFGANDLIIEDVAMDFEDPSGVRVLVRNGDRAITFTVAFSLIDASKKNDIVVEVSPLE